MAVDGLMEDGDGRIGMGTGANVMGASVNWIRETGALLFGLAVPRCWKLAVPTLDAF